MPKSLKVSSATVTVFVHSTEDQEQVRRAVLNILPPELKELTRISVEASHGYFGDPITVLRTEEKRKAAEILRHIVVSMERTRRKEFLNNIEDRIDKSHNLYIRLDKQQAFLGIVELGDSDSIRLKIHLQRQGQDLSPQDLRRALMEMAKEKPDSRSLT